MSKFYREHIKTQVEGPIEGKWVTDILFRNRREAICARFFQESGNHFLECSYYVGADWFPHREKEWFYVEPKLNTKFDENTGEELEPSPDEKEVIQIDVLRMLFEALQEPEVRDHTQELFEIKFDSPWIPLKKTQDLISPLIMIQFLNLVKEIVRKGLKKSYYKVQESLYSKVKGKVLVSQTIKQNLVKNKKLHTFCQYEVFGVNGIENRILKKTLVYIRRYMTTFKGLGSDAFFQETFNYIQPAFQDVYEEVSLNDIKHLKFNPFYKDYEQAIELAKLILQRFSYNLNSIQEQETIMTPPYWIDMSKLFELFVLGKLRKRFPSRKEMEYQFGDRANSLDFIVNSSGYKMIIDAKYKTKYSYHFVTEDMRQVSGYARLKKVHKWLGFDQGTLIDCLVIYPDPIYGNEELPEQLCLHPIFDYYGVYKLALKIPKMRAHGDLL